MTEADSLKERLRGDEPINDGSDCVELCRLALARIEELEERCASLKASYDLHVPQAAAMLKEAQATITKLEAELAGFRNAAPLRKYYEGYNAKIDALEAENKRLRELISEALDYDPHGQVLGGEWNAAALKEIIE